MRGTRLPLAPIGEYPPPRFSRSGRLSRRAKRTPNRPNAGRLPAGGSRPGDREIGMRLRALTLILLAAAWMVPSAGRSCPSEDRGRSGHAHSHASTEAAQSHSHADHDHGDSGGAAALAGAGEVPDRSPAQPTCCSRAPDVPAVQPTLQEAQSRPKLYTAVLPSLSPVAALPAAPAVHIDRGRQRPPPPPFASSRRPLLI